MFYETIHSHINTLGDTWSSSYQNDRKLRLVLRRSKLNMQLWTFFCLLWASYLRLNNHSPLLQAEVIDLDRYRIKYNFTFLILGTDPANMKSEAKF